MNSERCLFISNEHLELLYSLLLNAINSDALFGACLGAWLVTSARRKLTAWQHVGTFILSAGVGYLFAPVALPHLPGVSEGVCAFICALVIIPLSVKIMIWINRTDLAEFVHRLKGGK